MKHIDELSELKSQQPGVSSDDLVSFCNSRCVLYLYYLNGFNYVRGEYDDFDDERDWLQPFLKSMLIWHEDQMRQKMGLSTLLPILDGLRHSVFFTLVVSGHKDPYVEWEKRWAGERA